MAQDPNYPQQFDYYFREEDWNRAKRVGKLLGLSLFINNEIESTYNIVCFDLSSKEFYRWAKIEEVEDLERNHITRFSIKRVLEDVCTAKLLRTI